MTTELQMLMFSTILAMIYYIPYVVAYFQCWGLGGVVGNRENMSALPAWAERAREAHANMNENMIHFIALVLIAHLAGVSNDMTVLGATLFFYARIGFLVAYTLGLPWIRSLVYSVGLAGEVLIVIELLK